jgi:hypothetical protein
MQVNDVPEDQKEQGVLVDLPVGIPADSGEQGKNDPNHNIQQIRAEFLHHHLRISGALRGRRQEQKMTGGSPATQAQALSAAFANTRRSPWRSLNDLPTAAITRQAENLHPKAHKQG